MQHLADPAKQERLKQRTEQLELKQLKPKSSTPLSAAVIGNIALELAKTGIDREKYYETCLMVCEILMEMEEKINNKKS